MAQSGGPGMSALAPLLGAKRASARSVSGTANLPTLISLNQGGPARVDWVPFDLGMRGDHASRA